MNWYWLRGFNDNSRCFNFFSSSKRESSLVSIVRTAFERRCTVLNDAGSNLIARRCWRFLFSCFSLINHRSSRGLYRRKSSTNFGRTTQVHRRNFFYCLNILWNRIDWWGFRCQFRDQDRRHLSYLRASDWEVRCRSSSYCRRRHLIVSRSDRSWISAYEV